MLCYVCMYVCMYINHTYSVPAFLGQTSCFFLRRAVRATWNWLTCWSRSWSKFGHWEFHMWDVWGFKLYQENAGFVLPKSGYSTKKINFRSQDWTLWTFFVDFSIPGWEIKLWWAASIAVIAEDPLDRFLIRIHADSQWPLRWKGQAGERSKGFGSWI